MRNLFATAASLSKQPLVIGKPHTDYSILPLQASPPIQAIRTFPASKQICYVDVSGKVTLADHLDLSDVLNMPLPTLEMMQAIIEKAIKEKTNE